MTPKTVVMPPPIMSHFASSEGSPVKNSLISDSAVSASFTPTTNSTTPRTARVIPMMRVMNF